MPPLPRFASAKLNALCERERFGEIVRIRLTAHVVFPRVTAAFATAAGIFFPAERAADLRPARPDIHIGDSAITAGRTDKHLRFTLIVCEDRGAQALGDVVV